MAGDIEIRAVPPSWVDSAWPVAVGWLAPAIARSAGRLTPDDVRELSKTGDMQLWTAWRDRAMLAAWVTRIVKHSRVKVCEILFCGGREMAEWLNPGLAACESWAAENECSLVEVVGRTGWERALKPYDYRKAHIVLEKSLVA